MSRWAVRHPIVALIAWFAVLVAIGAGSVVFHGSYNDSFALPGASSTKAQDLLEKLESAPATTSSVKVVWESPSASVTSKQTKDEIDPVLKKLAELPFTECVAGPYGRNFGSNCPKAAPTNYRKAARTAATEALSKATGMSPAELTQAAEVLDQLEPLEKADPQRLAALAKALPGLAAVAAAPPELITGLASLTAAELTSIPGVTKADADAMVAAFGSVKEIADIPEATRKALAEADPAALAKLARALPEDVTKARELLNEIDGGIDTVVKAAGATQKVTSPVSSDDRVAYATVTFTHPTLTTGEANRVVSIVEDARSDTLRIGLSGSAVAAAGAGPDNSEAIGLLAAVLILALAFGSLIAAGLPIVVALTGLVAGQLLVIVVAAFTDVASFAPTLAAMIGLGVGIDYGLFILNRFTQGVRSGVEPKEAAITAVGTAGKAVAFAGSTVIVALLGMFVLGIEFFNGLALAAAVTVLMVMLSALWMLPALLSLLGHRSLGLRLPWARHPRAFDPLTSRWHGYGQLLQRAPLVPLLASIIAVGVLAWPAHAMILGFPDDGSDAKGSTSRVGFDLLADGFGPGVNGPFFVAVETSTPQDFTALAKVIKDLEKTPGVAQTIPSSGMLPILKHEESIFGGPKKTITSVIVQPATSPTSEKTVSLLTTIRDTTAPKIENATKAQIYVGGTQAVSEDFTSVLQKALPVFLLLVVGLGFLALMLLFHSIVIPLTAAITSLMSFAGALGVTVAVFQLGIADSLLGVTGTGPILPFLPVMVFAILFGLSMDYQVFLVSRMREAWEQTHDNAAAVRLGLAGSGRVVVVAATIMTCVFLSFVPTPIDTIKLFGVALASAVLIDAFIVRLVLVPSLMSLLGRANWWMPRWLDRILPSIRLE